MPQVAFHVPNLSPWNKKILILSGTLFLIQTFTLFMGIPLADWLGLSFHRFFSGAIFQIITYPFMQSGFFSFLFNALLIWFIGSDLERSFGVKKYLLLLLTVVLSCALFFLLTIFLFFKEHSLIHYPMMGLSGITYALLLAYGLEYKDQVMSFMMIFPMRAKYFCLLLIGIEVYLAVFSADSRNAIVSWGHLMSFAVTFLFLRKAPKKQQKTKLRVISREEEPPRYWQ